MTSCFGSMTVSSSRGSANETVGAMSIWYLVRAITSRGSHQVTLTSSNCYAVDQQQRCASTSSHRRIIPRNAICTAFDSTAPHSSGSRRPTSRARTATTSPRMHSGRFILTRSSACLRLSIWFACQAISASASWPMTSQLKHKVGAIKQHAPEFFRVDIGGGVLLDGWCIKPPDFDATKKYPVLVHVYGEPAGQTVLDRWGGSNYLWHLLLAQHGYVVMSFDNRGTPAPRGRDWRKWIYRKVGILAPQDQAAAVRAVLKQRSWIDPDRIGVWGWSGGGSMTLHAMFRFPDLYKTGIAVAPVANERYYDTIYQERYMGLPSDNMDGYVKGSPIHYADQLKGNLLIIHGTGDDNCHYATTEMLINELIRNNKRFTMMAYPNRTHAIREGQNTTRHLRELMTDYLLRNLPAGPR